MLMPDRAWIAAHIPHQGGMCLLDGVLVWDAQHIRCAATSHRDPANPLREQGRLGAANAIEYAAQAMAVHGALLADTVLGAGYLASVRGVRLHAARLDDAEGELCVEATRLSGDDAVILYAFTVAAAGRCLAEGRASVVLDAASFLTSP